MAKCVRCGRGGLFKKVNADSLCSDCAALAAIESEQNALLAQKDALSAEIAVLEDRLQDKQARKLNQRTR